MIDSPLFWLSLNLLTIVILAFFSMEEMAAVSFNKVRLQFYVAKKSKRAIWLNELLQNSSTLFATTLIGVNVATFVGSECARNFHAAIGVSPDLAPISQVMIVIIFGELAPMFAARRYSEHVALLGVPIVYFTAKVLTPLIWILGSISKLSNTLLGGHASTTNLLLNQDELQKIFEDQDESKALYSESQEFNAISSNIFRLKDKLASNIMSKLTNADLVRADSTVGTVRSKKLFSKNYLVVYRKQVENVMGIVFIKDLIRAEDHKKIQDFCNPPWFITLNTPLIQILKQFRRNSENVAIVLSDKGYAEGFLTFDDLLDEIFGETGTAKKTPDTILIDQTLDAKIALKDLKKDLNIDFLGESEETLSNWLNSKMEHHPEVGDTFIYPPYTFTIEETSLLGITKVHIKS